MKKNQENNQKGRSHKWASFFGFFERWFFYFIVNQRFYSKVVKNYNKHCENYDKDC